MAKKQKYTLEQLQEAMKKKQAFEAYVENVDNEYNLHCIFANEIKAIIPREEASCLVDDDGKVSADFCNKKKGKIIQACIKELIIEQNELKKVILSRKELELKVRKWMYMNLKPGMKLKGIVRGFNEYAAFIDVGGGVSALLKIEEISSIRIEKVTDKLKLGQRIQAVVKKYDRDTGRIELSLKDAMGTFVERVRNIKEGSVEEGIVRGRAKTGLIIELKHNLVAMSEHISGIEYGQKVLVYIKKINIEKEKIKVEIIG